jgi:hypothetical protein
LRSPSHVTTVSIRSPSLSAAISETKILNSYITLIFTIQVLHGETRTCKHVTWDLLGYFLPMAHGSCWITATPSLKYKQFYTCLQLVWRKK